MERYSFLYFFDSIYNIIIFRFLMRHVIYVFSFLSYFDEWNVLYLFVNWMWPISMNRNLMIREIRIFFDKELRLSYRKSGKKALKASTMAGYISLLRGLRTPFFSPSTGGRGISWTVYRIRDSRSGVSCSNVFHASRVLRALGGRVLCVRWAQNEEETSPRIQISSRCRRVL